MGYLPIVSGKEAVATFEKAGWRFIRYSKKNHIIMGISGNFVRLSIPNHRKLDRGLLENLIKDAGLTVEEFKKLLD